MILIATGTHTAYHTFSLIIGQTVVHSVAASTWQTLYILRRNPTPLLI